MASTIVGVVGDVSIDLLLLAIVARCPASPQTNPGTFTDMKFAILFLAILPYHLSSLLIQTSNDDLLKRYILPTVSQVIVVILLILVSQGLFSSEISAKRGSEDSSSEVFSSASHYYGTRKSLSGPIPQARFSSTKKPALRVQTQFLSPEFCDPRAAPTVPGTAVIQDQGATAHGPSGEHTQSLAMHSTQALILADGSEKQRSGALSYLALFDKETEVNTTTDYIRMHEMETEMNSIRVPSTVEDRTAFSSRGHTPQRKASTVENVLRKPSNRGQDLLLFDLAGGNITPITPVHSFSSGSRRADLTADRPHIAWANQGSRQYKPSLLSGTHERFPRTPMRNRSEVTSSSQELTADSIIDQKDSVSYDKDLAHKSDAKPISEKLSASASKALFTEQPKIRMQWRSVDFGGNRHSGLESPMSSPTFQVKSCPIEVSRI